MSIIFVCMVIMAITTINRVTSTLQRGAILQLEQTSKLLAAAGDDWTIARLSDIDAWAADELLAKAAGNSF